MSLAVLRPHKLTEAEVKAIIRNNERARRERLRYDGRQMMGIRGYPFKIAVPHGYGNSYGMGVTRFMLGHIEFQVSWKLKKDGTPSEMQELVPSRKLPLSWIRNIDEPNGQELLELILK